MDFTGVVVDNVITQNWDGWHYDGGGICISGGTPLLVNNLIVDNRAYYGAGIAVLNDSVTTVSNCTIANNDDGYGSAIYLDEGDPVVVNISNSIIWGSIYNYGSTLDVTFSCGYEGHMPAGEGNITDDPLFVSGWNGDYYLSQVSAGQPADSPCVNEGSTLASDICFTTPDGTVCMDQLTTRTDLHTDSGTVDMGYHYSPDRQTTSAEISCSPVSGRVPFETTMTATLNNHYPFLTRRLAAHVDVTIGNGEFFWNWRSGFTNVAAGASYETSWPTTIPALGSVIGKNIFIIVAEDVTPSPYNQPPHPMSGDTDLDFATVTATVLAE